MITTVTGSGLRCRDNLRAQPRVANNGGDAVNVPVVAHDPDEPTLMIKFTSLVLLSLALVCSIVALATLLLR